MCVTKFRAKNISVKNKKIISLYYNIVPGNFLHQFFDIDNFEFCTPFFYTDNFEFFYTDYF